MGYCIIFFEEVWNKFGNCWLELKIDEICIEYKGKIVELFCLGYWMFCCVLCFVMNYWECYGIKMIDELVIDIKSMGEFVEVVDVMIEIVYRVDE